MAGAARSGRGRWAGVVVVAAGALAAGCERAGTPPSGPPTTLPQTPVPAPGGGAPVQADERRPERASFLVAAGSCERLAEAVRPVALKSVTASGFGGTDLRWAEDRTMAGPMAAAGAGRESSGTPPPTASTAGVDFSGTNVQEAGVDEPDVVKTDGRLLVTTADGRLRVVDVSGPPRQIGELDLPGGSGELLLVGNRALVLSDAASNRAAPVIDQPAADEGRTRPTTTVTVVDLGEPATPRITRTHTIDGRFVDARLVGGVARIVTSSQPDISFPQPSFRDQEDAERAQAANAEIVRKASATAFLPKGASCGDAYLPVTASGVGTIAVQSVDPAADAPGPAVTVVTDASTVYASANRLFVATNSTADGPVRPAADGVAQQPARTAIHAFDISDPGKARYAGSGDVPGRLLNQFSMSEDAGVLRVATTLDGAGPVPAVPRPTPVPGPPEQPASGVAATSPSRPAVQSESRVTILRPAGEEWVETGAVGGLGKGERIYAVRFLGATGYVVTFRQVDPLYVLDLRDVRAPKLTGELKITGYSAYLHPAGDRRLLGIGQEATEEGRRVGTQLSLFDIGDPAAPTKLAGAVLPSASSSAEHDHHAFLYWPAAGLVVAPVQSYGGPDVVRGGRAQQEHFVGAVAFRIGDRSVDEAGRITHPGSTPIERSLVVGDRLLTLSRVGLAANDVSTLADGGYVTFR